MDLCRRGLILFVLFTFLQVLHKTMAGNAANQCAGSDVTYEEMKRLSDSGARNVIDVRESAELTADGTIPGAVHIPLAKLEEALRLSPEDLKSRYALDIPDHTSEVVVHCRSGRRGLAACEIAHKAGYTNTRNYKGGITEWNSKKNA